MVVVVYRFVDSNGEINYSASSPANTLSVRVNGEEEAQAILKELEHTKQYVKSLGAQSVKLGDALILAMKNAE